jgi:hypothetical protein
MHTLFIGRIAVSFTDYRQGLNGWEKRFSLQIHRTHSFTPTLFSYLSLYLVITARCVVQLVSFLLQSLICALYFVFQWY